MFGVPFEQIAPDRGPLLGRHAQLASRARRRVRGAAPTLDPDLVNSAVGVVAAFLAAARGGDFDALRRGARPRRGAPGRLAAPDRPGSRPPCSSARRTCPPGQIWSPGSALIPHCQPALVNGTAGLVARLQAGRGGAVIGITVASGRITEIDLILDPDKLPAL